MALARLSDFGSDDIDPPHFKEVTQVWGGTPKKRCGAVGVCPERNCWAYYSPRLLNHDKETGERSQFLQSPGYRGYAVSDDVLDQLRHRKPEVGRIFFGERDEKTVYEFQASAYLQYGEDVEFAPDHDPQTFRPVREATHTWPDHYGSFKLDPEVSHGDLFDD